MLCFSRKGVLFRQKRERFGGIRHVLVINLGKILYTSPLLMRFELCIKFKSFIVEVVSKY